MLEFWQICYIFTTVVICYEEKKTGKLLAAVGGGAVAGKVPAGGR